MPLMDERTRTEVRQRFARMAELVRVMVFTENDCEYCAHTRQLAEELAELSEKIQLYVVERDRAPEIVASYGIDKFPAIALLTAGQEPADTGIRFFGIPAGYEFGTLVEDILAVSGVGPSLAPATKAWLETLDRPVHIQVFVTPTCPYCPRAVLLAHRLALASPLVRADMVEASEFPELADRYNVYGVPRTVINETVAVEGAVPEAHLLTYLRRAVEQVQVV